MNMISGAFFTYYPYEIQVQTAVLQKKLDEC